MGGGILPVSLHKGALMILLGQERDNTWSDFGGGAIKGESVLKTSIREGTEELCGILGSNEDLEKRVLSNLLVTIDYDRYTSHVFRINYDNNLPNYFNNINIFAEIYMPNAVKEHNGLFEKKQIRWFKLDEFKNINKKKILRPWYPPIIESIIKNEEFLKSELTNYNFQMVNKNKKLINNNSKNIVEII